MKSFSIPKHLRLLLLFTLANLIILGIRNYIVGSNVFDFLKSNLFSGMMPLFIAIGMRIYFTRMSNKMLVFLSLIWLVFYPNSPYMISDLIHPHEEKLNEIYPELIVYDTLIVFSIAMLSVFYGFVSLKLVYMMYENRYGKKIAHSFIIFSIILSCLGFYIGRELKSGVAFGNGYLYSWQIFTEPMFIIKTTWHHLFPIRENMNTYYMMALFGFIQYQLIVTMKDISDIEGIETVTKDEINS